MNEKTKKLTNEIKNFKRITPILSYKDLEVYQISYNAAIIVILEVLDKLPANEKFDSKNQLQRSCKAVPRLIAEGYAKKHQHKGFQKYLDDAIAESNETEVGLLQCVDLYDQYIDIELTKWLAAIYNRISRQTYKLRQGWQNYKNFE